MDFFCIVQLTLKYKTIDVVEINNSKSSSWIKEIFVANNIPSDCICIWLFQIIK